MKLIVVLLFLIVFSSCSKHPPLAKSINLPIEKEYRSSSLHDSKVALIYSKKAVEYDLYRYICEKASSVYGGTNFDKGVELDISEIPKPDLIEKKYSINKKRGFEIESIDQYSSIWVIDYEKYVVVLLVDRR